MKGTEKQIAWAEDIKAQVMEAAHEAYEGSMDQTCGTSFEESKVGHTATFASDHMDDAKFWIDSIGYKITDYGKRAEAAKSKSDLAGIVTAMSSHFMNFSFELSDKFFAEEDVLTAKRSADFKAYRAEREAAKATARASTTST